MTLETAPRPVLPPPAERGRLHIDPGVVRKIAQHAADTVPGTARVRRRIAGLGVGSHGAHTWVRRDGHTVDLAIDLALRYPAAIRDVVDQVRAHVTDEITRLTAHRVRSLDVTVSALLPDIRPRVE